MVVCALIAAGASAASSGDAKRLPAPLTLDGVGGVVPGLAPATVERRWGVRLELDRTPGSSCQTTAVRAGRLSGYAIFIDGRFRAVHFRRGAETPKSVRIGSTLAQLRAAYGSLLTSRPNKYTRGATDYFVRRVRRPQWELRFDVAPQKRVTAIAFGDETVRLVEGCS
jgi:hypothetical protein